MLKKSFFIISLVAALLCSFACSKQNTLDGTKWFGSNLGSYFELSFTNNQFSLKIDEEIILNGEYSIFDNHDITFITTTSWDNRSNTWKKFGFSFTGTIEQGRLTLNNFADTGIDVLLIKR